MAEIQLNHVYKKFEDGVTAYRLRASVASGNDQASGREDIVFLLINMCLRHLRQSNSE